MSGRTSLRNVAVVLTGVCLVAGSRPAFGREEDLRLTPSDWPTGGGGFGRAVAVDGRFLVVGAPFDSDLAQDSGAVYVFRREGEGWVEEAKLTAPDQASMDESFGVSVDISGDWIVVGKPGAGPGGCDNNRAYLFHREPGTPGNWVLRETLGEGPHCYGMSVAIDGGRLAVGEWGSGVATGWAYVYRLYGTSWGREATLVGSDSQIGDLFGDSVSISGDRVVVGASSHEPAGAAYVFKCDGETCVEEAKLTPEDAESGTLGGAVSIDGDYIIAGKTGGAGSAYVFRWSGTNWVEDATLYADDGVQGDRFGCAVSLSSDLALVGAKEDDDAGTSSGSAYIFRRVGMDWVEEEKLVASDASDRHLFGAGVSLDCRHALVGGLGTQAAYLYAVSGECPPVPVLSGWGLIVLACFVAIAGSVLIRRRSLNPSIVVLILIATFVTQSPPAFAQVRLSESTINSRVERMLQSAHHDENLLVRFDESATVELRDTIHAAAGAVRQSSYRFVSGLQLVRVPDKNLSRTLTKYLESGNVLYAEPDYVIHTGGCEPAQQGTNPPDDPLAQWGLDNIRAVPTWDICTGDPDFRIAVLDSGVDYGHEDLATNIWTNPGEIAGNELDDDGNGYIDDIHGYNFVGDAEDPENLPNNPWDDYLHGTHVAGIIGAIGNNGKGVVGVNWRTKIVAVKFLGAGGNGSVSDAVEAIEYVIANDIKLSCNSWGHDGSLSSQALYDVIEESQSIGHLFVTISHNQRRYIDATCRDGSGFCMTFDGDPGNSSCAGAPYVTCDGNPKYPGSYDLPNIITVGAIGSNNRVASFSSFGILSVDIAAPGVDIWSTRATIEGGGYATREGTSHAAPHVTGAIALLWRRLPALTWEEVRDRVLLTARVPGIPLPGVATRATLDALALVGDCNDNGVLDECEIDCHAQGCEGVYCNANTCAVLVESELEYCGLANDCNDNDIVDACEPDGDCDSDQTPDICEIYAETAQDCNNNRVDDACEENEDANNNAVQDICDIAAGTSQDCNCNDVPDESEDRRYVRANATPGGNGRSWATAYNDVEDALAEARPDRCIPGGNAIDEIWVAEGTYKPDDCDPTCDRDASFELASEVRMYGGFPANGGSFADRDPKEHLTILSGDLNDDDGPGPFDNNDENSYHILRVTRTYPGTMMDGFIVTGGSGTNGGGMYNLAGKLMLSNCIFRGNYSGGNGGAIYALQDDPARPSLLLINCLFTGNSAGVFSSGKGGAIYNSRGDLTLINSTLSGNSAMETGGGIYSIGTEQTLTVLNSIFWGNTGGTDELAQIHTSSGTTDVSYSCIQNCDTESGGLCESGSTNIGDEQGDDPSFVDADGIDDIYGTADDDARLGSGSPAIDAGDNDALPPDSPDLDNDYDRTEQFRFDLDINARVIAQTVDMGAYEYPCSSSADCDDDNDCTTDVCTDGFCSNDNKPSGRACDDGLYCTPKDKCDGFGHCEGGGVRCKLPQLCCEFGESCYTPPAGCALGP